MLRGRWPLTARGVGALVLALACVLCARALGIAELQYLAVLLVALLVLGGVSLIPVSLADGVERRIERGTAQVGSPFSVRVGARLRARTPLPPADWREAVSPGLSSDAAGTVPTAGRGGDLEVHYDAVATARGIRSLGPFTVTVRDPFSLTRRVLTAPGRTEVIVAPAVPELAPLAAVVGRSGDRGRDAIVNRGEDSDNVVARPYQPGDSVRRIHWRATARRDSLMMRQEERESAPTATVVLDRSGSRWAPGASRGPGIDRGFETAVSACAAIVCRLLLDGHSVALVDAGGTPLHERVRRDDQRSADDLVLSLAAVTAVPGDGVTHLAGALDERARGPVVVIAGRLELADAAWLAPYAVGCPLPVLLAVHPGAGALERLGESGWRTAPLDPEVPVQTSWTAALSGRAHVA